MNSSDNKYWTDDPDLVEKYILNKISAEDKKRLDAEIADCEPCKLKLQEELEIVAGIRHYGRDILKAKLRKKLQREKATHFFAYQYVGLAAAVIIIAIGLGAYQIWFSDLVAPKKFHTQEFVIKQSGDSTGAKIESPRADDQKLEIKPQTEQKESSHRAGRVASSQQREMAEIQITDQSSSGAIAAAKQEQISTGAVVEYDKATNAISSAESSPSAIWLIGKIVVISEPIQDRMTSASKIQISKDASLAEERHSKTNSQSLEKFSVRSKTKKEEFVIQQRSIKDLPVERSQQQAARNQEIETLLERTENGLRLTLFVDSLKESELTNAVVERLSDDSLVVSLPNQRIAYHLPSGWNSPSFSR